MQLVGCLDQSHQHNLEVLDHPTLILQNLLVLYLHLIDLRPHRRRTDDVNQRLLSLIAITFLDLLTQSIKLRRVAPRMETQRESKSIPPPSNAIYAPNGSLAPIIFAPILELILMRDLSCAPSVEKPLRVNMTESVTKGSILARRSLSAKAI